MGPLTFHSLVYVLSFALMVVLGMGLILSFFASIGFTSLVFIVMYGRPAPAGDLDNREFFNSHYGHGRRK